MTYSINLKFLLRELCYFVTLNWAFVICTFKNCRHVKKLGNVFSFGQNFHMDSFSRKKFILDIAFFFLLMRNAVAFESTAKFCFSSCYDQNTGKLSRHYSLHKQRDLSFNWVKKYCNFWDERNNIIIMLVLHYKNHILWNKGNIQNSAR